MYTSRKKNSLALVPFVPLFGQNFKITGAAK